MVGKKSFLPLIETKAHAGFVKNFEQRVNYDDRDWFTIPGHGTYHFPGDVLDCQVQPNIHNLLNGSLVLLVTKTGVMARRFDRLEKDTIILQDDNQEFSQQQVKIEVSEIQQALSIRGKITSMLVPNHQLLSNCKINDLEETVDWLKKEMFSLNKQMQTLKNKKG